jgi:hypothetical protein
MRDTLSGEPHQGAPHKWRSGPNLTVTDHYLGSDAHQVREGVGGRRAWDPRSSTGRAPGVLKFPSRYGVH